MINRKFLHFNTEAAFRDNLANIPYDSIVFIRDSRKIYTHGAYYLCNTDTKSNSEISYGSTTVVYAVPGQAFNQPSLTNPHNLPIQYNSSNQNVAVVDSYGFVTIANNPMNGDSTIITASFTGDDSYASAAVTYKIVVSKADPNISWDCGDTFYTTLGASGVTFPSVINNTGETLTYTYTSNKPTVATVNNGEFILNSAGDTLITATSVETSRYKSKSISFTLVVRSASKQDPELKWMKGQTTISSASVTFYTENTYPTLYNPSGVDVTFESLNPEIATINGETGKIEIISAGTTKIIAHSIETSTYNPKDIQYTLVVNKKASSVRWNMPSVSIVYGQTPYTLPELVGVEFEELECTSSNNNVATVNDNGLITIVGGTGSATITVKLSSTDNRYSLSLKSCYVDVSQPLPDVVDPDISWSSNSVTVTYGESSYNLPTLNNPNNVTGIRYSSSDATVATIGVSSGSVQIKKPGTTTISAIFDGNNLYNGSTKTYTLTITKKTPTLNWSSNTASVRIGEQNTYPTLNNPDGLTISYTSSNTSVATITSTSSGYSVTLKKAGSTTITATASATTYYNAKTASYTLTVTAQPISWSSASATVSKGYGSNQFPTLNNLPSGTSVSYTSSDTSVATISNGTVTIKAPGTTTITATANGTSASYTLTVNEYPGISWSRNSDSVELGTSGHLYPTLTNTHNLSIIYGSNKPSVATINSSTGEINPVSAGQEVTISATSAGTQQYSSQTVSYTLTVTSTPEPGETFSVGYGYRLIGSANFVFDYKDNATTVAGEYTITVPGNPDNPNDPNARLVLSVPAKSSGNEITKIEYNSILGKADITSLFTRFISNGKAYYWSSEDRPFVPGTHRLVVS